MHQSLDRCRNLSVNRIFCSIVYRWWSIPIFINRTVSLVDVVVLVIFLGYRGKKYFAKCDCCDICHLHWKSIEQFYLMLVNGFSAFNVLHNPRKKDYWWFHLFSNGTLNEQMKNVTRRKNDNFYNYSSSLTCSKRKKN
jgi:hypothetical protein